MAAMMAAMSFSQTVVTPPANATKESWNFSGIMSYQGEGGELESEDVVEPINVVFDDNDLYLHFPNPLFGSSWVKGTKSADGSSYVFANGQYLGSYYGSDVYFCGSSDSQTLSDVTFTYNEESKVLVSTGYILFNGSTTTLSTFCYFSTAYITKESAATEQPVALPEGVKPMDYSFSGYDNYYNQSVTHSAQVAINGNDIYVSGLSEVLPEAWIKGTLNGSTATFAANQFMGSYYTPNGYMKFYFNPAGDVTFEYDAQTGKLSTYGYITATPSGVYDDITNAVWTKIPDVAAIPAKPEHLDFMIQGAYKMGALQFTLPTTDENGNALGISNLYYTLMVEDANGQVAPLTLNKELYTTLDQDYTEIPNSLNDETGYLVQKDGDNHLLFLLQGLDVIMSWKMIGVKSIYKGGNETHESEVVWYDIQSFLATGIHPTFDTRHSTLNIQHSTTYNLQGQKVENAKKGLYIKNGRKVIIK